jgi:prepilin-type N-terminal cleavage/methylation domain-containing protein
MKQPEKRGFTLIELLIVVAVLAVLSVVVILVLNPAELLKQSRDSRRITDLATIKKVLSLYLVQVKTPTLTKCSTCCYTSTTSTISATCGGRHNTTAQASSPTPTLIDGTGWVGGNGTGPPYGPDITAISSGSPISHWPLDPINNTTYFYSYVANTSTDMFEIDAKMESVKYSFGGPKDVESTDGGSSSTVYEVGTAPSLNL